MNFWLEVFTEPKVVICYTKSYLPASGIDTDSVYPYLASMGTMRASLSLPNSAAGAANITIIAINYNHVFTDIWKDNLPHQAIVSAKYYKDNAIKTYFTGRIDTIKLGDELVLGIVAPLVKKIPLRRSTVWEKYSTDEALPIGFGTVTLQPRRYDRRGKLWHLVDGVADEIISVYFKGNRYGNAGLVNTKDETGQAVALMEVGDAVLNASDWKVKVRINNKTNPANVIYDLLTLSGEYLENDLLNFSNECSTENIEVNGLVTGEHVSTRSQIDEILLSVGCGWSQAMRDVARLWPPSIRSDEPVRKIFSDQNASGYAQSSESEIVTELLVKYGYDWASNRFTKTILLRASPAYEKYGYKPASIEARWVVSDRQALELGKRWLSYYSMPIWKGTVNGYGTDPILPGDLVSINIEGFPIAGEVTVVSVTDNLKNGELVTDVESKAGLENTIGLYGQTAFDSGTDIPLLVVADDDFIQVTALDKNGVPASGATVTIANHSITADSNGKAVFPLSAGIYDVSIRYPDGTVRTLKEQSIGL